MSFNLVLSRINYLTYLLPLAFEGHRRGLKVYFFLEKGSKAFSDPYQHLSEIKKYQAETSFEIKSLNELPQYPGITFLVEGNVVGLKGKEHLAPVYNYLTPKHHLVSIVCNYEVFLYLDKYLNKVHQIIFPDSQYLDFYKLKSSKFLCLGSPKYDSDYPLLSRDKLLKKYKLPDQKYAVLMFPKNAIKHHKKNRINPTKQDLLEIYSTIKSLGLTLIVKNRKQDQTHDPDLKGDYYFEDLDNYPVNSMELIQLSDLVIFFSSSLNEECIYLRKPYFDFKVDFDKDRFPFFDLKEYSARLDWRVLQTLGWDKVKPRLQNTFKELLKVTPKSDCWKLPIPAKFHQSNISSCKQIVHNYFPES